MLLPSFGTDSLCEYIIMTVFSIFGFINNIFVFQIYLKNIK